MAGSEDTHTLHRVSRKGGKFIGRCMKCGREGLGILAVLDFCDNPRGLTNEQALLEALEDDRPDGGL